MIVEVSFAALIAVAAFHLCLAALDPDPDQTAGASGDERAFPQIASRRYATRRARRTRRGNDGGTT